MRPIGNYIGFSRTPGSPDASGVWGVRDTPITKTPFLTDLFDGSAGVLLSDASHSPQWANLAVEGLQSSLARSGSSAAVRGQVDDYGNSGSVLNTGKTNFYAQGVVAAVGGFAVYARTTNQVSSPGNYSVGYAFILDSVGGASIVRAQRFSSTVLASTRIPTMQVGDVFGISANGATISAFFNGSQIMSVVDSTFTAGTFCGLSLLSEGASASRFDVFDTDISTAPTLLDSFPNAAAAYSLRPLRQAYGGAVVRVRRSSDNAQADFLAQEVSEGALQSWVGAGNSGFVTTWYDQSGNGRHATNATSNSQPIIVLNGSLLLKNNKPCVSFARNVTLPTSLTANFASTNQNWVVASVCSIESGSPGSSFDYGRVVSVGTPGAEDYNNTSSFVMCLNFQELAGVAPPNAMTGLASGFAVVALPAYGGQYIFCGSKSGSTVASRVNGGGAVSVARSGTLNANTLRLGANVNYGIGEVNSVLWGSIQEVIYYQTDRAGDVASIIAAQNNYYGAF
jgi:hypothetical protein